MRRKDSELIVNIVNMRKFSGPCGIVLEFNFTDRINQYKQLFA